MYNYDYSSYWGWEPAEHHAVRISAAERKELMSNRVCRVLIKFFGTLNYMMADAEPKRRVRAIRRIRRRRMKCEMAMQYSCNDLS